MPLVPSNSTHAPSDHPARAGLAPIARTPRLSEEEEDLGSPPDLPSFCPGTALTSMPQDSPPPWSHELRYEVMQQERGRYVLTWNSLTEDDLQGANATLPAPVHAPRPAFDQVVFGVGTPLESPHDLWDSLSLPWSLMVHDSPQAQAPVTAVPDLPPPCVNDDASPVELVGSIDHDRHLSE